jgi:hypothetical protein
LRKSQLQDWLYGGGFAWAIWGGWREEESNGPSRRCAEAISSFEI